MKLSAKAEEIASKLEARNTKLGDLRNLAKALKKDHTLAMELWSTGKFYPMQLSMLIMDTKQLSGEVVNRLIEDIDNHKGDEKLQLADWLMANQLSKDKKTTALMLSWEESKEPLKRRLFWYHQARLRWVGQTPPPNTEALLASIEKKISKEEPEVQWAMNFTAGQIGVFQPEYRPRCIAIGEKTGLYKDEVVAKNCTPSYLPKFIPIQVAKLKK